MTVNKTSNNGSANAAKSGVSRRALMIGLAVAAGGGALGWSLLGASKPASAKALTVWKSPTCGCCGGWVAYMRGKGYEVVVNDVAEPNVIKQRFDIPGVLYSCHTTKVGDYLVEGHVPEAAVAKLLAERPKLKGIALPGMPDGSPGMDGPPGIYRVVGFSETGQITSFAAVGV
jgi:hypothetical protein